MKRDRNLVKLENSVIIALYIGEIIKSIESIFLFLFFFIKYLEKKKSVKPLVLRREMVTLS